MTGSRNRINIDQPRWDQSTYWGRARHFFVITNPLNILRTSNELERAKNIVIRYRKGENVNLTEDELWKAKNIYDSAFHPETGEKMLIIGRMSAQVPMNMFITGAMLTFYRTKSAVVFWQWFNQSFNATVNYNNRSGDAPITTKELLTSYIVATTCALGTALGFNRLVKKAPRLIQRFGPFIAVAAANCVNLPLIRYREIENGTEILSEDDKKLGRSKVAAKRGIAAVVLSRIGMAVPTMAKYPRISMPVQIGLSGIILTFSTPLCCALFPQKSSIAVSELEPELQEKLRNGSKGKSYDQVYYNKGL